MGSVADPEYPACSTGPTRERDLFRLPRTASAYAADSGVYDSNPERGIH